jgi:predicted secreted protein/putative hemolysin
MILDMKSRAHKLTKLRLAFCAVAVLALLVLACGCTQKPATPPAVTPATTSPPSAGMPNPASVYCGQAGGTLEIKKDTSGNEYGMCSFQNGTSCEEWTLFRGEGCKPGIVTTTPAAEGKKLVTFDESHNGTTERVAWQSRFAVQLKENPTTGFEWNATLSPGLTLSSTDYRQDPNSGGMVGVGGTRTWIIETKELGNQTFSAVYKRGWEPATGNETTYTVTINSVRI